jgi:hypothetical protein
MRIRKIIIGDEVEGQYEKRRNVTRKRKGISR